jgi:hypothetical protein
MLHHVEDEANGLLSEGRDQIIVSGLLTIDAMEPEAALRENKPAHWLVHPEGGKTEAVEAGRPGLLEVDEVLVLHM